MTEADETLVCFCNRTPIEQVKRAIRDGAKTLGEIYDKCGAGNGPCGGSCRENLKALLEQQFVQHHPASSTKAIDVPPELTHGVSLFNRRYYWEAHEVLEEVWMHERGPRRLFYQGLIQAAAALYHVLNANPKGAIRLAQEARDKLQAYVPTYLGVELEDLIETLKQYEQESKEILGGARTGFSYEKLPRLMIGKEMDALP